jgi:hypothetical protein
VRFIQDEFELGRLRNKHLKASLGKWLSHQIDDYKDALSRSELLSLLKLISTEVTVGDTMRLRAAVADTVSLFDRGRLMEGACAALADEIALPSWRPTHIRRLVDLIIQALSIQGHEPWTLQNLLQRFVAPSEYELPDGGTEVDFPFFPFARPNVTTGPEGWAEYQRQKLDFVHQLPLSGRIGAIASYYKQEPAQFRIVTQARGLTLTVPLELGPVYFYAPAIRFANGSDAELFRDTGNVPGLVNITTVVEAKTFEMAASEALRRFEAALDAINAWYVPRPPIIVHGTAVLALDSDGRVVHETYRNPWRDEVLYNFRAFDLSNLANDARSFDAINNSVRRSLTPRTVEDQRIGTAIGFGSRAVQSRGDEAILNSWIGIDSLLTVKGPAPVLKPEDFNETEDLALAFFPAATALQETTEVLLVIRALLLFSFSNRHQPRFEQTFAHVPPDLAVNSGLVAEGPHALDLGEFVRLLPEWAFHLSSRSPLRDLVIDAIEIYSSNRAALGALHRADERARLFTNLIYQLRNRLVHHAFSRSFAATHFAPFAISMLHRLLGYAVDNRVPLPEGIALTLNIWSRLKEALNGKQHVDLLRFNGYVRQALQDAP